MLNLQIITTSTREGRKGDAVARWFVDEARGHGKFAIEPIDLAVVNLPLLDEPNHPRLRQYTKEHTKQWSATISRADAFVFVLAEYNYNPPPPFVNAIDYLQHEWSYKPCGFVSYGGVSGGTRALQAAKLLVTAVKMMPMMEAVSIPFFGQHIDKETGAFAPPEMQAKAAATLLDELMKWATALKTMRA